MQCNIDAKGKAVRLATGLLMASVAIVVLVACAAGAITTRWVAPAAIGVLALGLFGVFEGAAGWCALRAMGVRTRL